MPLNARAHFLLASDPDAGQGSAGPRDDAHDKKSFVRRFEAAILSGRYRAGDKLPAERDLAMDNRISRPIIHEGLLELARKGFVTIKARKGTFVNDFRRLGSPELLASLFSYAEGKMTRKMHESLLEMRLLFEVEAARKAASRRTDTDLRYLDALLEEEAELLASMQDGFSALHPAGAADLDFRLHQAVMLASGNEVYPMLFNTIRKISQALLERLCDGPGAVRPLFASHQSLVSAIREGRAEDAAVTMRDILLSGGPADKDILPEASSVSG